MLTINLCSFIHNTNDFTFLGLGKRVKTMFYTYLYLVHRVRGGIVAVCIAPINQPLF